MGARGTISGTAAPYEYILANIVDGEDRSTHWSWVGWERAVAEWVIW
jgi:hypothetical protein